MKLKSIYFTFNDDIVQHPHTEILLAIILFDCNKANVFYKQPFITHPLKKRCVAVEKNVPFFRGTFIYARENKFSGTGGEEGGKVGDGDKKRKRMRVLMDVCWRSAAEEGEEEARNERRQLQQVGVPPRASAAK